MSIFLYHHESNKKHIETKYPNYLFLLGTTDLLGNAVNSLAIQLVAFAQKCHSSVLDLPHLCMFFLNKDCTLEIPCEVVLNIY